MKQILVGTDLSASATVAVRRACKMAAEARGEVRIVLVAPPPATEDARTEAENALDLYLKTALPDHPPPYSTGIAFGAPHRGLLEEAEEFWPDLIVVGAHGEPHLREGLVGSTVTRLLWDAPCPILIAQSDPGRPYHKALAAIDGRTAESLICFACAIPSVRDLHVVHAYGSGAGAALGYGDVIEDVRIDQKVVIDRALDRMQRTKEGHAPVRIHAFVEEGEVASVIAHAWRKIDPDLAVLGSHGRSGMSWLLGSSVAETTLLSHPTDILVMPPL